MLRRGHDPVFFAIPEDVGLPPLADRVPASFATCPDVAAAALEVRLLLAGRDELDASIIGRDLVRLFVARHVDERIHVNARIAEDATLERVRGLGVGIVAALDAEFLERLGDSVSRDLEILDELEVKALDAMEESAAQVEYGQGVLATTERDHDCRMLGSHRFHLADGIGQHRHGSAPALTPPPLPDLPFDAAAF